MPRNTKSQNKQAEDEDLTPESEFDLQYLTEQHREVKLSDEFDYFSLD